MSKGLRSWVRANWVDIANRRSDGSFPKCGRSKGEKRKNYPKCVPAAKARSMSSCLLYTSPSPRDGLLSRMPSSA